MQILMPSKSALKTFANGTMPFSIPNGWPVRSSPVQFSPGTGSVGTLCNMSPHELRISHYDPSLTVLASKYFTRLHRCSLLFSRIYRKKKPSHFKDKLRWTAFVSYVASSRSGHIATADNRKPDSMEILGSNVIMFSRGGCVCDTNVGKLITDGHRVC